MGKQKIKRRKSQKMRRRGQRIVKTRSQWKRVDETKRLRWLLVVIAVVLTVAIAVGGYFIWKSLPSNFFSKEDSSSLIPGESEPEAWDGETLPIYSDDFNLVLVNASHPLSEDFVVNMTEVDGVMVEERIARPLQKMLEDAEEQGYHLKLVSGYVSKEDQEAQHQAKVQELMKEKGYSKIKAEDEASAYVEKGGYSEYQTGMAVNLTKEGLGSGDDFSETEEYRWLIRNSIFYGFIQRNPENKTAETGMIFEPGHFRYVGVDHAKTMRQLEMCLEEYTTYVYRQTHW